MFKYLKYEYRRNSTYILSYIGLYAIYTLINYFKFESEGFKLIDLFILSFPIVMFTLSITTFYKSLYDDLNRDEGYFTFSLPVSSYNIIGSKILLFLGTITLSMVINFIIYLLSSLISGDIFKDFYINNFSLIGVISDSFSDGDKRLIIYILLFYIAFSIYCLISMYFSILVSSLIFKKKKAISILIFSVKNILIANILSRIFIILNYKIENIFLSLSIIFILLNLAFFLLSGFLLDKKLELN